MRREPTAGSSSGPTWIKSSYSDSNNPNDCVEIATAPPTVHVRDSKDPRGPRLAVEVNAWTVFVAYVAGV
ncbi:DUF397 domain-containing protein [Streptomyces sp. NPDC054842]